MLGTLFDKVTGLFDKRFTLALLLPTFALGAGGGALAATMAGWHQAISWWTSLGAARQVALGIGAAAAVVVLAIIIGTQVLAMTRFLEGYWSWPVDKTAGHVGRWWQAKRQGRLAKSSSSLSDLRSYLEFPEDAGKIMPTRLGNALRAAESYPGERRWGLDAVFWWPRLHLILPDSARSQVDDARASVDQLVVLTMLSAAFGVAAFILSFLGLNQVVGFSCAGGGLLLSGACYRSAVTSATVFGDLVRSCYDLYRADLLKQLGWPMPPTLPEERRLWAILTKKLYRGDVDNSADNNEEALLNAPRQPAGTPGTSPLASRAAVIAARLKRRR